MLTRHILRIVQAAGSPAHYARVAWFASFQEKLEARQQQKAGEEFKKELEFLVNKPSFTLQDMRQRVLDGLSRLKKGIKAKLMTGTEQTEIQLTKQRKILNAMTDEELLNIDLLKGESKKHIALVSQTSVEEVNSLLKHYKYMRNLQGYLKQLKESGSPLPETQEELIYRFRRDKPVSKSQIKFELRQPTFSRRQIRRRIKWGPRKSV
eukprot:TRINITY_DN7870_c0_g1_i2.p1 TRINITY_DN7870_c0_g1~~TRINITY_DN7870_c0_g1_i2.p1  ORF type:complete len:208 (+),score=63.20 TRINITY_DN7870_c0_g1_i2:92-715(+)